jgi:hypothetical protein
MKAAVSRFSLLLTLILQSSFSNALNVTVLDNEGTALSDIVIYAEPLDQQAVEKTNKKLVISQAKKSFTPYISVAQTGNTLAFNNRDDITHHIYSANAKRKFAFLIRPGESVNQPKLETTNEIVMGCNVHDWMSGYLLVVDTPYFEKTAKSGKATLAIKGKGRYKIIAWHPQLNEKNNRVVQEINISETQQLTLKLNNSMHEIPEQKSEDGFDFLSDY